MSAASTGLAALYLGRSTYDYTLNPTSPQPLELSHLELKLTESNLSSNAFLCSRHSSTDQSFSSASHFTESLVLCSNGRRQGRGRRRANAKSRYISRDQCRCKRRCKGRCKGKGKRKGKGKTRHRSRRLSSAGEAYAARRDDPMKGYMVLQQLAALANTDQAKQQKNLTYTRSSPLTDTRYSSLTDTPYSSSPYTRYSPPTDARSSPSSMPFSSRGSNLIISFIRDISMWIWEPLDLGHQYMYLTHACRIDTSRSYLR